MTAVETYVILNAERYQATLLRLSRRTPTSLNRTHAEVCGKPTNLSVFCPGFAAFALDPRKSRLQSPGTGNGLPECGNRNIIGPYFDKGCGSSYSDELLIHRGKGRADGLRRIGVETKPNKWIVLAITLVGIFMSALDSGIVNISLPKISLSFHVPLSGIVEWVIIGYLVIIASLLLTFGRLADVTGWKMLWTGGLAVFTASSALCGAAPSLPLLVAFRVLQGVGAAMTMAISLAMIASAFPVKERGRIFGMVGAVVSIATSAGPTVGGIITQAFSWRWIFYINIPIGVAGILATLRFYSDPEHPGAGAQRFDPVGAVLLSACVACLMLGISFGQEAGWSSSVIVGLFSAAAILLAAFLAAEARVEQPIVDFSLFRNRLFSSAVGSSFLSFLALFAVTFLMPFYLEELLSFPPWQAGLLMTVVPLTIAVVAPLSGILSDRIGSRVLSSMGLAVGSLGLWFLSNLTPQATIFDIVWPLAVTGVGQGLFQSPNNNAIMSSVPLNRLGIANGFQAIARVLGQGFSVALAGAVFTALGGAHAGAMLGRDAAPAVVPSLQATFIKAFHSAMLTCMIIAAVGVLTSLVRGRSR